MKKMKSKINPIDLRGKVPETWACVDCGVNTAPGLLNRAQLEQALAADTANKGVAQTIDDWSEVYLVKAAVWKAARMPLMGGCLCIGCLESRVGRRLTFKDFPRHHPLNKVPGTKRLLERRDGARPLPFVLTADNAAVAEVL